MKLAEVMTALKKFGGAQTRKTQQRHGCTAPSFGVKIGDLKTLVKKIRTNTPLARELYGTGNADAMYLAGLVANGAEMSRDELDGWAKTSPWHGISDYPVAWVTVESPHAWDLAREWIESPKELLSEAGWHTLAGLVSTRSDAELDIKALGKLIDRVMKTIAKAPNRTRYAMNDFIIATGSAVKALTGKAVKAAGAMGPVEVDMGDTACQVPDAAAYIRKVIAAGKHGAKRKTMKC